MFMRKSRVPKPKYGYCPRFELRQVPASIDGLLRNWSKSSSNARMRSKGHGMSISAESLRFDEHTMWVELTDGRTVGVPLAWFPRLLRATPQQRQSYRIGVTGQGLHWDELDEDISVAGLLEVCF